MTDTRPLLLIVDDNRETAFLLGRLLREDGYDVEVETDGPAAIKRLTHAPIPDALITDFNLPGADGLVVGRHARASREGMPIFVLTGDPHAAEHSRRALEAVDILTKPVDYKQLVRHLRASLQVLA